MIECMSYCNLNDVKSSGRYCTWNNKHDANKRVFPGLTEYLQHRSGLICLRMLRLPSYLKATMIIPQQC